ncbi:uncharacterized protein LOC108206770 isoform X2 [Daucus carota subsp. sativus]|uniref:uncharacterized protein LOC108206770 isoform X2 n=1 Tax=Daucus carota subsp. sativus TaxID=79200 RepID=UPI003083A348
MHRQSLGSPNSKLHTNGVLIAPNDIIELTADDLKTKHQLSSQLVAGDDDEELRKSQKPQKSPEKLIHIIPMLIIFCFLILYLTSHDPSQEISSEIDDLRGVSAIEKSGVLAVRSLQEEEIYEMKRSRINRKLGDFYCLILKDEFVEEAERVEKRRISLDVALMIGVQLCTIRPLLPPRLPAVN